jgi:hypothetical protein
MVGLDLWPSAGALEEIRRVAGSSAAIRSVARLEGGGWTARCHVEGGHTKP